MNNYTFYNLTTGDIVATFIGPESDAKRNTPPYCAYIPGLYDPFKYYISDGKAIEKTQMIVKVVGRKITGLPNPTTALVETSTYTITDGVLEFSSNAPGPYTIKLSSPKYLTKEVVLQ